MAIRVFQVQVTDAMADEVNAAGCWSAVAWGSTYLNLTSGFDRPGRGVSTLVKSAIELGLVKLTRVIDTDSLDEAFAIGNGYGDESKQTVLEPSKSISVGDIMVGDVRAWAVASFGFDKLDADVIDMLNEMAV